MKTYPLSQSQLGIYLDYIQHPESMQYNIPYHLHFPRSIDTPRLKKAIETVLSAYPVYYTRVITEDDELRQYPDFDLRIDVPVISGSEEEVEGLIAQFLCPFNLQKDPLCRFLLIESPETLHFLFDLHHLIADGIGCHLFLRATDRAYSGQTLPEEAVSMYEFAQQEQQSFQTLPYEQAAAYYKAKFEGAEMTKLPEKSNQENGRLKKVSKFIPKSQLNDFCTQHEIQPNWLFMAAFGLVLSRFSREETVAYTSINHGRHDRRLLGVMGMFVKTVPMLMQIDPTQPVVDFIKSHKQELMSTLRHDAYPFTHFCKQLGIKPELNIGFLGSAVHEQVHLLDVDLIGERLMVTSHSSEKPSILIYKTDTAYEIRLKYVECQYEAGYMQRFAEAMEACVEQLVASPDKLLRDISIVSKPQRQELIALGQGEELSYDRTETFIDLFLKQAALRPNSTAIVDKVSSITYAELDRQSDLLAHALVASGVDADTFVAVMLPRRKEFLISVIAVFKAGGAYIPLDNYYPNDRLLYMLEDSAAKVLITTRELFDQKRQEGNFMVDNILFVDEFDFSRSCASINRSNPQSLAYMIYTSGSTGRPKGVLIEHKALRNFVEWLARLEDLKPGERYAQVVSFSFDISICALTIL